VAANIAQHFRHPSVDFFDLRDLFGDSLDQICARRERALALVCFLLPLGPLLAVRLVYSLYFCQDTLK